MLRKKVGGELSGHATKEGCWRQAPSMQALVEGQGSAPSSPCSATTNRKRVMLYHALSISLVCS